MTQNKENKRAKRPLNNKKTPPRGNETKKNITGSYTEVNPSDAKFAEQMSQMKRVKGAKFAASFQFPKSAGEVTSRGRTELSRCTQFSCIFFPLTLLISR